MRRESGYLPLAFAALVLLLAGPAAFAAPATTVTVKDHGVRYTLPANPQFPRPHSLNPLRHQYEYMSVVVKDRELFINCVSRYKAKPGDDVRVTYVPNEVWVNGKLVPQPFALPTVCP